MRKHANKRSDKKKFSHSAARVHPKNARATPMRGGFRL